VLELVVGILWGLLAVGWGWTAGSRFQRHARWTISLLVAYAFLAAAIVILLSAHA
jgi:hypothetical protein